MRYFSIVVAGWVPFVLAACTIKSGDDNTPKYKYPDANSFCAAKAQAQCNQSVVNACVFASADACVSQQQGICARAIPAGKNYDPTKAEACVNKVSDAYQDASLANTELADIDTLCSLVFNGTSGKDSSCSSSADCDQNQGLKCIPAPSSAADAGPVPATGTCQVPKPAQGGESCAAADALCVTGFHCGSSSHCDINSAKGEPCSSTLPCQASLQCLAPFLAPSGASACQDKYPNRTACTDPTGAECLNGICMLATAGRICASQITLSPSEPTCQNLP